MKIKLDENLPRRLVAALSALGHDVDSSAGEGLTGRDDLTVWQAAQTAGRFLITQDLGFSDIRRLRQQSHAGVMILRFREPGRNAIVARVRNVFQTEPATSWTQKLVVLTERKLRVRSA